MFELSKQEHSFIMNEHRIRDKWENRPKENANTYDKKIKKFNELPFRNRDIEHFIDPFTKGWQYRYYKKLHFTEINKVYKKQICTNYLEGLEWTLKYYTNGCINYRWCYKYDYPPLLEDLIKYIPRFDCVMINKNLTPIDAITQLSYVLPYQSLHLLSKNLQEMLLRVYKGYYTTDLRFEWAYCKYFWESHPVMKYIDIDELEEFVQKII